MFKEGLGRLMFERKLYFWLILGAGTYHVPRRRGGGDPCIRYTLRERNLSIVIYLDPEEEESPLFKPLFEIGSIEVLTDYMYGKSNLDTTTKI